MRYNIQTSTIRFRIVVILLITLISLNSYAQQESDYSIYADSLSECIISQNYQKGIEYIRILQAADTLSPGTLLDCIDCYERLEKYEECITFCESWLKSHPNCHLLLFDAAFGECYYMLDNNDKAIDYLGDYIDEMEAQNFQIQSYYYGLLANSLYASHLYKFAEETYEKYFDIAVAEDNLTRSTIYMSKYKDSYGKKLYNYAYNFFFQGKEKEGLEQLKLSKECGNKKAIDDYKILSSCPTFAKDFQFKRSVINEFTSNLEKLDAYDSLSYDNPSAFWYEIQEQNPSYKELNLALNKSKRPGTLKTALSQLNTNKTLIENGLVLCKPFTVSEMEKSLEHNLCGDKTFLKELRVYPAESVNAFATPFGEIYLTSGLVYRYHFNKEMLLGVCAHEASHYICQHSVVGLWKQAKKEKKNEMWAGIAVGLNTLAHGVSAMYGASNGVQYDDKYWDNVSQINNNLMQGFKEDAYYFQFKYGRSQEIESDIIAYRFLEHIGVGGYAYIMALQLLGNGDSYVQANKNSDHPTINFRVGLLKYLYNKEHTAMSK